MFKQYEQCTIPRVFPSMDEKLRKSCNSLTGWKTPEAFRAFWNWVNGGKKNWTANAALYHESKTGSPAATARNDLRKIGMDDAFFMFWLIAKQGVDRAAAGYLFGIDPPSVGRYFITITCILEDFIRRQFPVMSDEEIYLTQHLKWAAQMGQPVRNRVFNGKRPRVHTIVVVANAPSRSVPRRREDS